MIQLNHLLHAADAPSRSRSWSLRVVHPSSFWSSNGTSRNQPLKIGCFGYCLTFQKNALTIRLNTFICSSPRWCYCTYPWKTSSFLSIFKIEKNLFKLSLDNWFSPADFSLARKFFVANNCKPFSKYMLYWWQFHDSRIINQAIWSVSTSKPNKTPASRHIRIVRKTTSDRVTKENAGSWL